MGSHINHRLFHVFPAVAQRARERIHNSLLREIVSARTRKPRRKPYVRLLVPVRFQDAQQARVGRETGSAIPGSDSSRGRRENSRYHKRNSERSFVTSSAAAV